MVTTLQYSSLYFQHTKHHIYQKPKQAQRSLSNFRFESSFVTCVLKRQGVINYAQFKDQRRASYTLISLRLITLLLTAVVSLKIIFFIIFFIKRHRKNLVNERTKCSVITVSQNRKMWAVEMAETQLPWYGYTIYCISSPQHESLISPGHNNQIKNIDFVWA